MKVAEVLRALLHAVDNAEVVNSVPQARNDIQNLSNPEEVTVSDNAKDPEDLFLPPLQMKIELLKKAVGVDNVYDDGTDAEQEQQQEEYVGNAESQTETSFEKELSQIKKAAGINPVVMNELVDDEPLES